MASVVSSSDAIEAAFWSADRTTFVGSMTLSHGGSNAGLMLSQGPSDTAYQPSGRCPAPGPRPLPLTLLPDDIPRPHCAGAFRRGASAARRQFPLQLLEPVENQIDMRHRRQRLRDPSCREEPLAVGRDGVTAGRAAEQAKFAGREPEERLGFPRISRV